jgi:hypothetical protein
METTCSQPMRNETNLKFLNLGSNIKDNMLYALSSSYFLKNEKKTIQNNRKLQVPTYYVKFQDDDDDNNIGQSETLLTTH